MKRNTIMIATVALLGATPLAALAQTTDQPANGPTQGQIFAASKVSLQQATDLAMAQVPGSLSAIGFNAENGMGSYEATIIAGDGTSWTVKIDADTGAVVASGQSTLVNDEEGKDGDGENSSETENGGENGGENGSEEGGKGGETNN